MGDGYSKRYIYRVMASHKVGVKRLSFPLIRSLQISAPIIFYRILKKTCMVSKVALLAYLEFHGSVRIVAHYIYKQQAGCRGKMLFCVGKSRISLTKLSVLALLISA